MNHKIAYSCYVDARKKFEIEALRWLWSLTDKLSVNQRDIYITCHPKVSPDFLDVLNRFEHINIATKSRFTDDSPPANKWLQLEQLESKVAQYTHFIISDCDKLFVSLSDEWFDNSVRACKFVPRPSYRIFENIFDKYCDSTPRFVLDKPDPKDPIRDPRSYVNNHNGGLLSLPASKLKCISKYWKKWIDILLLDTDILESNVRNLDQVAFSLTMHSLGEDINFLPKSFDIGTNVCNLSPYLLDTNNGQLVLHIHGNDDSDGLIKCGSDTGDDFKILIGNINSEYILWRENVC